MINSLKAEFRKVFTVRSTYFILAIVAVLFFFFAFYVSGWRVDKADLHNPLTLSSDVTGAINIVALFVGLIAILLVTHEYRYNTIMHTLTLSRSRSRVLLAKVLVITVLALAVTAITAFLSPVLSVWGADLNHLHFAPQTFDYGHLIWTCLFFGWGYAMIALLLASLIRNQIGAIVVLLIAPETIEGLLSLILKKNTAYLPFTALHNVIDVGPGISSNVMTAFHAALVFMCYLVVGAIVAWILFLRRDAN
jgi:ABC-2 type transport system permease protein